MARTAEREHTGARCARSEQRRAEGLDDGLVQSVESSRPLQGSTAAANPVCNDQYDGPALPERASARTQVLCAARATRRRHADAAGHALEVRQDSVVAAPACT